jgi:hypothetical protein
MIATKKYIRDLRERSFIDISEETEKRILEKLGKEPGLDDDGHMQTYTEQDLWEQIRKMIRNRIS